MLERGNDARLRVGRKRRRCAPSVSKKPERPLRRDRCIELPKRTRSRIARIGEDFVAACGLRRIQFFKIFVPEIDLAADVDQLGNVPALERVRNFANRLDVRRDVLTLRAVAARRGLDESTVLVADRNRESVDLRLRGHFQNVVIAEH